MDVSCSEIIPLDMSYENTRWRNLKFKISLSFHLNIYYRFKEIENHNLID